MTIHENIYKKLARLLPELESGRLTSRKLKAAGFMDLGLDVLSDDPETAQIALSHYYKHPSGDMIADPDMELLIHKKARMAEALTYQDSFGYRVVYHDHQLTRVDVRAKRELNSFLSDWLSNLLEQGHQ